RKPVFKGEYKWNIIKKIVFNINATSYTLVKCIAGRIIKVINDGIELILHLVIHSGVYVHCNLLLPILMYQFLLLFLHYLLQMSHQVTFHPTNHKQLNSKFS